MKEVQTELKMTEPQITKVGEKQTEFRQKMQELFQGGGGGGNREEMQAAMAKVQEAQQKAVAEILDTKQMKRFKQLELQQSLSRSALFALSQKSVADDLKLTEDQKSKIQAIQQAQMEEMRNSGGFGRDPNATPEEMQARMKKMQEMMKASGDKALAVLTDAQRKQLKEMQGEPFKFPENQGFGRGPGGGRPGGNPPLHR
jgi:hypothetical protein